MAGLPAEWGHGAALLMRGIPPPPCLPTAYCVLQRAEDRLDGDVYAFKNVKKKFLRWLRFLKSMFALSKFGILNPRAGLPRFLIVCNPE